MESNKAEEDSGAKQEGKEEAESSAGEDTETSSGVRGADQSIGYIVHFANMIELYQKKNWNCFGCSSPDHLMRATWKASLNVKEGTTKKGGQTPQKAVIAQPASPNEAPWA